MSTLSKKIKTTDNRNLTVSECFDQGSRWPLQYWYNLTFDGVTREFDIRWLPGGLNTVKDYIDRVEKFDLAFGFFEKFSLTEMVAAFNRQIPDLSPKGKGVRGVKGTPNYADRWEL